MIGGSVLLMGLMGYGIFKMGQSSGRSPVTVADTTKSTPTARKPNADESGHSAPFIPATDTPTTAPAKTKDNPASNADQQVVSTMTSGNTAAPDAGTTKQKSSNQPFASSGFGGFNSSPAGNAATLPTASKTGSTSGAVKPDVAESKPDEPEPDKSLVELIAMIEPALVRIDVRSAGGLSNGSGFLVDDGTIVTNYHVISGGQKATAKLGDKSTVMILGFTFIDPKRDIAILRIAPKSGTPSLKLIDDPPLKGESVIAMGAPLGLDSTASEGIVSSMRTADELETTLGITDHAGTWIQTTTPISPGNSGGPLVNRKGRVVAINTMTLTIGQNLNFAISAMDIKTALKNQKAVRPISPVHLPEKKSPGSGGSDARIVDIAGTPQAATFLGKINRIYFRPFSFNADPRRVVTSLVRNEAAKAIESAGIRMGGPDSPAFFVVLMSLSSSGGTVGAEELRVRTAIYFQDEMSRSPKVYKIWETSERLGTLSVQSLFNGVVPRRMSSNIKDFFKKLRGSIKRAKASAEPSV